MLEPDQIDFLKVGRLEGERSRVWKEREGRWASRGVEGRLEGGGDGGEWRGGSGSAEGLVLEGRRRTLKNCSDVDVENSKEEEGLAIVVSVL